MIINLDNIEVKEFSDKKYLKEDGEYVVTVSGYEKGTTSNGTPYLKFECKTDNEEYISTSLYLSEKAMWKFKKFLLALGHPGVGGIEVEDAAKQCLNRRFVVVCSHRDTVDPVTNEKTQSKYLEVVDFRKC